MRFIINSIDNVPIRATRIMLCKEYIIIIIITYYYYKVYLYVHCVRLQFRRSVILVYTYYQLVYTGIYLLPIGISRTALDAPTKRINHDIFVTPQNNNNELGS